VPPKPVSAPRLVAPSLSAPGAPALPQILIVDDSVVARTVIARMIDGTGRYAVAAAVPTADAALAFLRTARVDAVLLDIEMPGMDGLTALPDLIGQGRGARFLIVSSSVDEGAAATVQALALGAADTLVKPGTGALAGRFAEMLCDKLDRLLGAEDLPSLPFRAPAPTGGSGFDIVAIGASTGGIHALGQVLRQLPVSFTAPILVTQHLPASFTPYFAAQVAVLAGRPCDVAVDHLRIRPGRVVVAPGDAHIRVVSLGDGSASVRLLRDPVRSGCTPSVDPMFSSVADVFGPRALCVVLSGMGRDGSEGAGRVARAGGCVVVQDRATSVVWGMPGTVATDGHAAAVLPPDRIGALIASGRRPC
jgi:two-component system, chemotaxis family, protein-glutamate methylesterase/glutaminase